MCGCRKRLSISCQRLEQVISGMLLIYKVSIIDLFHSSRRRPHQAKEKNELLVVYKPSGRHSRRKKSGSSTQKQVLAECYMFMFG